MTTAPHSHHWINPADPPIARRPYASVVGLGWSHMKPGERYVCRQCGATLVVDAQTWRLERRPLTDGGRPRP